ncbi:hypothetical protein ANN_16502 [Periplaneta americana]|uniref:Tc1-like transposase DDE domain-containing protein n=1 Tax=Periplaneta americana TaxID=6978 RepID=A0ABQ8SRX4_PERAM|nr:hypothetical protein ANN_16502 [Periplaneta americana]
MHKALFSDETAFHTCGHVNKRNCKIWAQEQPSVVQVWQRDSPKANVWMEIIRRKCRPFMFAEPTTSLMCYNNP